MQLRADAVDKRIQLDGTTVEDARRAEGWSLLCKRYGDGWLAPKGRTRYFLFQPSLPLIQATLVRGAFSVDSTVASRLYCKRRLQNRTYTRSGSRIRDIASAITLSRGKWQ